MLYPTELPARTLEILAGQYYLASEKRKLSLAFPLARALRAALGVDIVDHLAAGRNARR